MRSPIVSLLLALSFAPACGDELHGDSASDESGADDSAGTDDDGDAAADPPPVASQCERYLACVRAADPDGWSASKQRYGAGSGCWDDGPGEAASCIDACEDGLADLHRRHPSVRACLQCRSDNECDTTNGEFCFAGGCEAVTCQDDGASCP